MKNCAATDEEEDDDEENELKDEEADKRDPLFILASSIANSLAWLQNFIPLRQLP